MLSARRSATIQANATWRPTHDNNQSQECHRQGRGGREARRLKGHLRRRMRRGIANGSPGGHAAPHRGRRGQGGAAQVRGVDGQIQARRGRDIRGARPQGAQEADQAGEGVRRPVRDYRGQGRVLPPHRNSDGGGRQAALPPARGPPVAGAVAIPRRHGMVGHESRPEGAHEADCPREAHRHAPRVLRDGKGKEARPRVGAAEGLGAEHWQPLPDQRTDTGRVDQGEGVGRGHAALREPHGGPRVLRGQQPHTRWRRHHWEESRHQGLAPDEHPCPVPEVQDRHGVQGGGEADAPNHWIERPNAAILRDAKWQ